MRSVRYAATFKKDFRRLPQPIRDAFRKQIELLLRDPRHPSLDVKKMKGVGEIWRAKVTGGWRFTFQIDGVGFLLRRIGAHDILRTP
jgi:mRNA-degrading endonuclease RelE of RelBE toxin-antitoxin system